MKTLPKYLARLTVILTASIAVFADSHEPPIMVVQQVASLTSSGPNNPAPPVPAGDIVQRDPR
ncbi:MAG TPA: hypothetical protein VG328_08320 [Stellaceae bacterium]|jgi:hypothetical protein|nr:hypothetical protein [Stellaceae bacterium]